MNEKILTTQDLKLTKARETVKADLESISTSDLDNAKLRRDRILNLATEDEKDRFAEMIRPRIEKEEAIVVFKCSNSSCNFRGRNRRRAVGTNCPICAKRAYTFENERFEAGELVELTGRELADFYENEKEMNARCIQEARERQEAQNIIAKAGFVRGVSK
jgi:hypothetical protein